MKSTIKVIDGHQTMVKPSDNGDYMMLTVERDRQTIGVLLDEDQINAMMFGMECALYAMKIRRDLVIARHAN